MVVSIVFYFYHQTKKPTHSLSSECQIKPKLAYSLRSSNGNTLLSKIGPLYCLLPLTAQNVSPKIVVPPNTKELQFMLVKVTGTVGGKKLNTIEITRNTAEKMLTKIPNEPSVQGPHGMDDGSEIRFMVKRMMGMR